MKKIVLLLILLVVASFAFTQSIADIIEATPFSELDELDFRELGLVGISEEFAQMNSRFGRFVLVLYPGPLDSTELYVYMEDGNGFYFLQPVTEEILRFEQVSDTQKESLLYFLLDE